MALPKWGLVLSNLIFVALFICFLVLYLQEKQQTTTSRIGSEGTALGTKDSKSVPTPTGWTTVILPVNRTPINELCPNCAEYGYQQDPQTLKSVIDEARVQPLIEQAKANFMLSRYTYQGEVAPEKPFLSIVTRTCDGRDKELQRCVDSVRNVIGNDFEHVILSDQVKAGMLIAETALCAFASEFRGDYICHLDDDDYLCQGYMVEELKSLVASFGDHPPKVIIFKIYHHPWNQVMPSVWRQFPREGEICTNCVAIRRDVYQDRANIGGIAQSHAGDWNFISNCLRECTEPGDLVWFDRLYMAVSKNMIEWDQRHPTKDFVTVELNGGLGNQMFQVAVAVNEAKKSNREFVMDHSVAKVSTDSFTPRSTYFSSLMKWVPNSPDALHENYFNAVKEEKFAYTPIPRVKGHIRFEGFFQSSKYFEENRNWILTQFRSSLPEVTLPLTECKHTIMIHVRRGDYCGHQLHTDLSILSYYEAAFDYLQKRFPDEPLCFYVFSDDLQWCQENKWPMREQDQMIFVDTRDDVKTMAQMSQCKHAVLANSSFSWWSRVLSLFDTKENVTIAPKQWFVLPNPLEINDWSTVYEPDWIIL